jgi:quinol-cytochrome oxidoreductase complex cytochrome b subunit
VESPLCFGFQPEANLKKNNRKNEMKTLLKNIRITHLSVLFSGLTALLFVLLISLGALGAMAVEQTAQSSRTAFDAIEWDVQQTKQTICAFATALHHDPGC